MRHETTIKGWRISRRNTRWFAVKHGVRMCATTRDGIALMIDQRPNPTGVPSWRHNIDGST